MLAYIRSYLLIILVKSEKRRKFFFKFVGGNAYKAYLVAALFDSYVLSENNSVGKFAVVSADNVKAETLPAVKRLHNGKERNIRKLRKIRTVGCLSAKRYIFFYIHIFCPFCLSYCLNPVSKILPHRQNPKSFRRKSADDTADGFLL